MQCSVGSFMKLFTHEKLNMWMGVKMVKWVTGFVGRSSQIIANS